MKNKTEVFLSIIENHKKLIYKVVNAYCKNKAHHDDLFQEISIQIWSSLDKYNEQWKTSTWIYRIALNTAISFYRKNSKSDRKTEQLTGIIENSISEGELNDEASEIHILNRSIQELKEMDKAIVLLYLDDLSQKEIAAIVGISPTNVSTKLNRIKNRLKNKINPS